MIKILVRVLGVLIAVEAVFLVARGFDAFDEMRKLDATITRTESELVGHRTPQDVGEQKIAEYRQQIAKKQTEGTIWFGAAAGVLLVGIGTALAPSFLRPSRKKKVAAAEPAPAQKQEAPGGKDEGRVTPPGGVEPAPTQNQEAPGL
jgi:hypothetical protein